MKNIYKYITLPVALLTLAACDDYLDVVPDNRTEIDTVEKMAKLIADAYPKACYAAMLNPRVDFVSDKGAGYTEYSSNTYQFFWRDLLETSQDTPIFYWRACYYSIAEINHALEAAEKMTLTAEQEAYIAEAKMIRAYAHHMLVSLYAKFYDPFGDNRSLGVPYVTEPEKTALKSYDRRTVEETYASIEQDLKEAIDKIGSSNIYTAPTFHFTPAAAQAFATRFYLFKGDWDKVIEHASRIIPQPATFVEKSGVKNVAESDAATLYAKNNFQPWLTTLATATGSDMVKAKFSASDNPSNLLMIDFSSRLARYVNSFRYATLYADVYGTCKGTNVTNGEWGYRAYSSGGFHYYVPKFEYKFVYASINASTGYSYTAFPLFRTEEMLLSRAEAYAMKGEYEKAIADLNVFCRQRIVNYSEVSHAITEAKLESFYGSATDNPEHYLNKYNAYQASTWDKLKKCLILCILDFRRNEFMWEGLRYFDMHRYRIPITHTDYKGEENTLYPGDDRWVFQIPEESVTAGMELNPRENLLSREW